MFSGFSHLPVDGDEEDYLQMSSNRGEAKLTDADKLLLLLQSPLTNLSSLPVIESRKDLFNISIGTTVFARLTFGKNHNARIETSKTNEKVEWLSATAYLVLSNSDEHPIKLKISSFSNIKELLDRVQSSHVLNGRLAVNGTLSTYNDVFQLSNVQIHPNNTNSPVNLYDSHNGIRKDSVGKIIRELVTSERYVTLACNGMYRQIKVSDDSEYELLAERLGLTFNDGKKLIRALHQSVDLEMAIKAKKEIEDLATYSFIERIKKVDPPVPISPINVDLNLLSRAVTSFSFMPTKEQRRIAVNVLMDFALPQTSSHLLYGDVGYGKTAVMAMIIYHLIQCGKSVVLLAPAQHLAIQTHRVFSETFPEISESFKLVTTHTDQQVIVDDFDAGVCFVGTSALLFRDDSNLRPFVVIVDEEHRLGKLQREYYRAQGSHYLGVSATPIPRTIAGTLLGQYKTHTLTKCFVEKSFHGKLYQEEHGRRAVYQDIKDSLSLGQQILIVCPLVDEVEGEGFSDLISVEELYQALTEHFGDVWRFAHGKRKVEDNALALDDMRHNRAKGLVASTAIEVGIDLPHLKNIFIFHPERFGLSQLHQLRGRIVRQGGVGLVRLYSPKHLSFEQIERLQYFLSESDGARVAEYDAQRRGVGDLLGDGVRQSGKIKQATFIRHLVISYKQLKSLYDRTC